MSRRAIKSALWGLLVIVLVGVSLLAIPKIWARNSASLQLMRELDVQRSLGDYQDTLHFKPGLAWQGRNTGPIEPCHALWQSRLAADSDLTQAEQILVGVQDCPQTAIIRRWQGLLAWRMGHREEAVEQWLLLSPSSLVTWGRSLALADQVALGQALLETAAAQHPEENLNLDDQALLYGTLGDLSRRVGNTEESIAYYLRAWEVSGKPYDNTAFHLGQSYANQGDCQRAVTIWETALSNKPIHALPILDSSYLISLGACHAQLSNIVQAEAYLDAAQAVINVQSEAIEPEATNQQQAWLDRVRRSLISDSVP